MSLCVEDRVATSHVGEDEVVQALLIPQVEHFALARVATLRPTKRGSRGRKKGGNHRCGTTEIFDGGDHLQILLNITPTHILVAISVREETAEDAVFCQDQV